MNAKSTKNYNQMIGTTISKQDSGKMFYPSLTICQYGSGSVVFEEDKFFESGHRLTVTNYTLRRTPDLGDVFLQLTTASPNGSSFMVDLGAVEDRYVHLKQFQVNMIRFPVIYARTHCSSITFAYGHNTLWPIRQKDGFSVRLWKIKAI